MSESQAVRYRLLVSDNGFRIEFLNPFPDSAIRLPEVFTCDFSTSDQLLGVEILLVNEVKIREALSEDESLPNLGCVEYDEGHHVFYFSVTTAVVRAAYQKSIRGFILVDGPSLVGLETACQWG